MSALQDTQASEGESCLVKEAKKWAAKAAKDYKIVTHGERVSLAEFFFLKPQNHCSPLWPSPSSDSLTFSTFLFFIGYIIPTPVFYS